MDKRYYFSETTAHSKNEQYKSLNINIK